MITGLMWLANDTTRFVAEQLLIPYFSWASFVLLAINGAQMFILHQHRKQLNMYGRKIGYYERLSSFYRFVMKQQGVDVDEYVPREDGHNAQDEQF
jgi:hypothetical protein